MDDYIVVQANVDEYGTTLYGCNRCGTVVFDRDMHDSLTHPQAAPFEEEEEVDLDDLPDDEELPEVPEDEEPSTNEKPTPEMEVITP